jgi:hypothetical protein
MVVTMASRAERLIRLQPLAGVVVVLAVAVLGLAACGDADSSSRAGQP